MFNHLPHYWDNGKENGNYYSIMGYILGFYRSSKEAWCHVSLDPKTQTLCKLGTRALVAPGFLPMSRHVSFRKLVLQFTVRFQV